MTKRGSFTNERLFYNTMFKKMAEFGPDSGGRVKVPCQFVLFLCFDRSTGCYLNSINNVVICICASRFFTWFNLQ